jgi:hypothetical protein
MTLNERIKNSVIVFYENNNNLMLKLKFDDINVDINYINEGLKLLEYHSRIIDTYSNEGKSVLNKLTLPSNITLNNIVLIFSNVLGTSKGCLSCGDRYKYDELIVIMQDNGQMRMQQYLLYKSGNVKYDDFKYSISNSNPKNYKIK